MSACYLFTSSESAIVPFSHHIRLLYLRNYPIESLLFFFRVTAFEHVFLKEHLLHSIVRFINQKALKIPQNVAVMHITGTCSPCSGFDISIWKVSSLTSNMY